MTEKIFEIGMAYFCGGRLYLAVDSGALITFTRQVPKLVVPRNRRSYKVNREYMSIDIARRWKIPVDTVDKAFNQYRHRPAVERIHYYKV